MLSRNLLELLRACWRAPRPQGWLFPGQNRVNPLMKTTSLARIGHAQRRPIPEARRGTIVPALFSEPCLRVSILREG